MDTAITTRRMILGPLPALLAAVLLTGCVTVPAGPPAPRPNQAATTPPPTPAPAPDVQPAGGADVLVRIESDHPERARSGPSSRPPAAVPQRRVAAPAPRPGPPRVQPQQRRPAPARRPAVRPRTPNPVPQMRALCRNAGDVVSGAVSQLCRQTYGR
ncbi:hypothetical protein OG249_37335 [Streptomyces microflavus]|uniref:hypothetical protein n=1 Tax=Streptomyces microflavus TaxID=1919 RepID=UPI00224D03AE|nr:hypothetical protein [Streptomyces microflavus]MCX4657523.1 hypothetical protein [Streptomyces microflavus]